MIKRKYSGVWLILIIAGMMIVACAGKQKKPAKYITQTNVRNVESSGEFIVNGVVVYENNRRSRQLGVQCLVF